MYTKKIKTPEETPEEDMANNKNETKTKFTGKMSYLDDFKRLLVDIDKETHAKLEQLFQNLGACVEYRSPLYIRPAENESPESWRVSVALSRFDKHDYKKYLKFTGSNVEIVVEVALYNSDQYGKGVSCTMDRIKLI